MLFNSLHFAVFFPIVLAVFFLLPPRARWGWLLAASCYFYMAWEPAYLLLLLLSTTVDYTAALLMGRSASPRARTTLLTASLAANLGILFLFKYYAFFAGEVWPLLSRLRPTGRLPALDLVLPVGISFYTFQAMSYTIDVYRGRQKPVLEYGRFVLYILFFPQLVAGPIERASDLLPQLFKPVGFDYARAASGLRWIAWGLFKKMVVADRLAQVVNHVYAFPQGHAGSSLAIATVFFSFQIYCDFSGYCDIALGAARVLGIDLSRNFERPYFASSVPEFWRRWHTSLTGWFREYVYGPLGGNRMGTARHIANVLIVFLLSGLWHGARWTFLAWGLAHACLYFASRWVSSLELPIPARLRYSLGILLTFTLVTMAWVLFRAASLRDALFILQHLPEGLLLQPRFLGATGGATLGISADAFWIDLMAILTLHAVEGRLGKRDLGDALSTCPSWKRWTVYYGLAAGILVFGVFEETPFVYFQF